MDWNKICKAMRYAPTQSELAYQGFIKEMILEDKMGWSPAQITEQSYLQIGATERLVPDLIVRKDERNSFIVEVKKPGHKKSNGDLEQLLSYMKQLEVPLGIYWGDEVEVYWKTIGDGSDPVLLLSLNFNADCEDGDDFVNLFMEENFSIDAMRVFKEEREAKLIFDTEVNGLMAEVTAPEFQDTVKNLVREYLLNKKIDKEVIETVIGKVEVTVSVMAEDEEEGDGEVEMAGDIPVKRTTRSRTRRSVGARPFAYNLMKQIIVKNRNLSLREVYRLFRKKNYVEAVSTIDEKRRDRWFLEPEEILTLADGTKVAISNQWGFNNGSKPKMDFLREVAESFGIDASLPI